MKYTLLTFATILALASYSLQDLPVDCKLGQISGKWNLKLTSRSLHNICGADLSEMPNPFTTLKNMISLEESQVIGQVTLSLNSDNSVTGDLTALQRLAQAKSGEKATWDMVYNQGLLIQYGNIVLNALFQFSPMEDKAETYVSYCNKSYVGWLQVGRSPKRGCFIMEKVTEDSGFTQAASIIKGNSWKRESLPTEFSEKDQEDYEALERIFGTKMVKSGYIDAPIPKEEIPSKPDRESLIQSGDIPESFNWESYLPPVIKQECGSCYAVTTSELLMSRANIHFGKTFDVSYFDLLNCNYLSQGCNGGFAIQVLLYFSSHRSKSTQCFEKNPKCGDYCGEDGLKVKNWYRVHEFTGWYEDSERVIMEEVFRNGPVGVGFQTTKTFREVKDEVFHPTDEEYNTWISNCSPKDQFYQTSHAVLLYGWGVSDDGEKYWLVRNSWGEKFGTNGNFKFPRGNNMLGMESGVTGADLEIVSGF